jgi:hypothetical protein
LEPEPLVVEFWNWRTYHATRRCGVQDAIHWPPMMA